MKYEVDEVMLRTSGLMTVKMMQGKSAQFPFQNILSSSLELHYNFHTANIFQVKLVTANTTAPIQADLQL